MDSRRSATPDCRHSAVAASGLTRLGRGLRDLRISVTDRCNFRCTYCMPKEVFGRDYAYLPHPSCCASRRSCASARISTCLVCDKVRLTGGEPLLRRDLERLIGKLAGPRDLEVTLTTNGSLLAQQGRCLVGCGPARVTVSLDALDEAIFRAMNDVDFPVSGYSMASRPPRMQASAPIKINMVVKRGVNDHAILPMARHFRHTGHILRFIEFMDVGATNSWEMDSVLPSAQVIARINSEHAIEAVGSELSRRGRRALALSGRCGRDRRDFLGHADLLSPVHTSPHVARRQLFTCLFAAEGFDLRSLLRSGASDAEIAGRLAAMWRARSRSLLGNALVSDRAPIDA